MILILLSILEDPIMNIFMLRILSVRITLKNFIF